METNLKKELIKSVNAIKSKVKRLRDEDEKLELNQQKIFKPLSDPLKTIIALSKNGSNKPVLETACYNKNIGNINITSDPPENANLCTKHDNVNIGDTHTDKCIQENPKTQVTTPMSLHSANDEVNIAESNDDLLDVHNNVFIPFGIRRVNKKLFIGNAPVKFLAVDDTSSNKLSYITIGNKSYELTPGLTELLLRYKPNLNEVSENDKITYKDILINTSVHKRDYNPENQIKGDKSKKYSQIIKPLFYEKETCETSKVKYGGKLPVFKKYNANTDLIYWDDPNELIERLRLIMASRDAGNTNHDNEIISIIEELKEAGIIKE